MDLTADPVSVARRVRALAPKPGVVYHLRPGPLRLLLVSPSSRATAPGQLEIDGGRVFIGLENGAIELLEVQEAGRIPMLASDWARGWRRP